MPCEQRVIGDSANEHEFVKQNVGLHRSTLSCSRIASVDWSLAQSFPEFVSTISGTLTLVFARPDGVPILPVFLSQSFDHLVAKTKLPRVRAFTICATPMQPSLFKLVSTPKVVSERLGHSSVSFTMDVYSHAIPAMQADAAETVWRP